MSEEEAFQFARQMMARGEYTAAHQILHQLKNKSVDQIQVQFLLGQIAGLQKAWKESIFIYRDILASRPDIVRVRLELARAFFEVHDDNNAKYHFSRVLAEKELPKTVQVNIKRFLSTIHSRKNWALNFSLAAKPDNNVNTATGQQTVNLFGLPFKLSDDARKSSGLGLNAILNGAYFLKLDDNIKLEIGGGISHTEYLNGAAFDDTFVNGQIGPMFSFGTTDIRAVAIAGYRRFGGRGLFSNYGGQLSMNSRISNQLYFGGVLDIQYLDYLTDDSRDGPVISLVVQTNYLVSQIRLVRFLAGITRESTKADTLKNWRYRLGLGYRQQMPFGITLDASSEYSWRPFDEPNAIFGWERKDNSLSAGITLTKRDLTFFGFVPVIGYNYYKNNSSLSFFEFTRHSGQIGLTKIF